MLDPKIIDPTLEHLLVCWEQTHVAGMCRKVGPKIRSLLRNSEPARHPLVHTYCVPNHSSTGVFVPYRIITEWRPPSRVHIQQQKSQR